MFQIELLLGHFLQYTYESHQILLVMMTKKNQALRESTLPHLNADRLFVWLSHQVWHKYRHSIKCGPHKMRTINHVGFDWALSLQTDQSNKPHGLEGRWYKTTTNNK